MLKILYYIKLFNYNPYLNTLIIHLPCLNFSIKE